MIDVGEAERRVLEAASQAARSRTIERVPLLDALGRVLAEDVTSDVDSPPHDKSIVDGYAVRTADFERRPHSADPGPVELAVVEEVTAGQVPTQPLGTGRTTRIMTGAPIPEGADAVVMSEETEHADEPGTPLGVARFKSSSVVPGQNILRQGTSLRRAQVVLEAGRRLRSAEIGLLAEVGRGGVSVFRRPSLAVLATGNELVPPEFAPGPGQIRNSNGPMLLAAAKECSAVPIDLGIGRDDPQSLRELIDKGLQCDVLVLSGGVSAGALDLVPGILQELGVVEIFHKIRLKPGKPLFFGVRQQAEGPATLVFGLPGNPVSSFVCFHLFVRKALAVLGAGCDPPISIQAALAEDFVHQGPRTTYHPARLLTDRSPPEVEQVPWHGSADLRALSTADALAIFPEGDREYPAGTEIMALRL